MIETFFFALNAILPLVLMIVLGIFLRRVHIFSAELMGPLNSMVFYVLTPALLFYNIYNIKALSEVRWDIALYCVVVILAVFALGLLAARFVPDPKQKGVILQSSFRSNFAVIGISLANAMAGDAGVAVAAIVSALTIPLFNILSVISLTLYTDAQSSLKSTVKKIITNPLLLSCFAGLAVLAVRAALPAGADGMPVFTIQQNLPAVYSVLQSVARATSPIALMVIGGEFTFSAVHDLIRPIALGTFLRLIAAPLLGIGLAVLLTRAGIFSCGASEFPALIAVFGTPVAVNSAIMATAMDNDGQLAGQLVVWTTILSTFTIFLSVVLLRTLGLL